MFHPVNIGFAFNRSGTNCVEGATYGGADLTRDDLVISDGATGPITVTMARKLRFSERGSGARRSPCRTKRIRFGDFELIHRWANRPPGAREYPGTGRRGAAAECLV